MKTILPITLILLISACAAPTENKTEEKIQPKIKKEYLIAYNIHLPDTTVDDWEIMITDLEGKQKINITQHPDVAWTYYAYKNRLFFISDRDTAYRNYFLYETNIEGKNIRKISDLRLEDSWMSSRKNGEEMIVSGRIGKEIRHQLFLINTKTGAFNPFHQDTSARFSDPCFSPDGRQVVFSMQKNKRAKNSHEELFVMNTETGKMNQISFYPEENISAREYGYKAGSARWHPTENFISYVTFQDGKNQIHAVNPDGKNPRKLFETELSAGWHDWSSDGNWLTFNGTSNEKQYHIYLMNWKTKEIKQLTDTLYSSQLGPVFIEK